MNLNFMNFCWSAITSNDHRRLKLSLQSRPKLVKAEKGRQEEVATKIICKTVLKKLITSYTVCVQRDKKALDPLEF